MPSIATPSKAETHAVVRIGGLFVGLPSVSVVKAMPMPADLRALPRRGESALAGVFAVDGRVVPVIELSRWVETGPAPADAIVDERVLVLAEAGRWLGIRVDAVLGVRALRAGDDRRIHHDEREDELFQRVAVGRGTQPMLNLLEVGRLMRLADVWCEQGGIERPSRPPVERNPFLDTSPGSTKEAFATFLVGDSVVGLRAIDIAELMPTPELQRVLPTRNGAQGVFRWRERLVPAVDLTRMLGATPDPTVATPWLCIVRRDELTIGLLVREVRDLVRVDTSAFRPELADPTDGVLLGAAVTRKGATLQLVDTAKLSVQFPEMQISLPRASGDAEGASGRARDAAAYMVFDAGTPFASPIDAVKEVVSMPDGLMEQVAAGVAATLAWRGHAVAVVDLERVLPHARPSAPRQLVVVAQGDRRAAVPIDGVRLLLAAGTTSRSRLSAGGRTSFEMITVETPGQQASFAVLDLQACLQESVAA